MVLTLSQTIIASDIHRYRVVNCGRQFGKTTLAIEEIKGVALAKEARIVYVATTIQQARDIAWNMLKKELVGITLHIRESPNLEIEVKNIKGTHSTIQLRGWESIETLRGQQFDFIVLDEVASVRNFWVNWQEVLLPTLSFRKGSVLFISTPKGFNHFYDLYNFELKDKDFKSFHFTSWENPYLSREELENTKAKSTPDRFAQEYEASFQKTQGLVYKEFDREKHLYDELPKENYQYRFQKLGAVDFGYRNPAAVLTAPWDGETLWIDDEWYKRERTDNDIADYVALCKFKEVYPDPENQGGIEELRRRHINVKEVVKGPGSIKIGINMVRDMFVRGDLRINKRCVNLISELEMYSYDNDKGERNEQENPIKANDHACDALRYLVSSLLPMITRQNFIDSLPRVYREERKNPAR